MQPRDREQQLRTRLAADLLAACKGDPRNALIELIEVSCRSYPDVASLDDQLTWLRWRISELTRDDEDDLTLALIQLRSN